MCIHRPGVLFLPALTFERRKEKRRNERQREHHVFTFYFYSTLLVLWQQNHQPPATGALLFHSLSSLISASSEPQSHDCSKIHARSGASCEIIFFFLTSCLAVKKEVCIRTKLGLLHPSSGAISDFFAASLFSSSPSSDCRCRRCTDYGQILGFHGLVRRRSGRRKTESKDKANTSAQQTHRWLGKMVHGIGDSMQWQ